MKEKKKKGQAQLYLERIEKLEKQICRKKDKAALYRSKAGSTTASMNPSGASGGGNRDKLGGWMDAALDLEEEIKEDERMLKDWINEAYALLNQIKNDQYYKMLEMHYLRYMTFDQIAPMIDCTYRNTLYVHGRALQVFDKLLEEYKREHAARYEA